MQQDRPATATVRVKLRNTFFVRLLKFCTHAHTRLRLVSVSWLLIKWLIEALVNRAGGLDKYDRGVYPKLNKIKAPSSFRRAWPGRQTAQTGQRAWLGRNQKCQPGLQESAEQSAWSQRASQRGS